MVVRDEIRTRAAAVTSSTACSNAASFALEGLLKPLSFLTNCKAEARISASVAGGSKLNSVLMFLHIFTSIESGYWNVEPTPRGPCPILRLMYRGSPIGQNRCRRLQPVGLRLPCFLNFPLCAHSNQKSANIYHHAGLIMGMKAT
jgi:hypothetical protein